MFQKTLREFKEKFEKFGGTLPLDWQREIPILLREIDGIEKQIDYHSEISSQIRIENTELKSKILNLEKDKAQALGEVQELKRKMIT